MDAAQLKETVQETARTVQENLAQGIGRVQERMEERVRRGADQTSGMFASLNDEFGAYVRESPIIAIGSAFAVGYMIAKLARAFK
ncbi:MAG TPA: hypothetical protein VKA21_10470 [Candidatus Binatia bacterium]|nr:hypothetical protein [Candidatus Binatia bacterium]